MFAAIVDKLARGARRLSCGMEFVRCRRGAAAAEFALISIPFVALLGAIMQTALVFFAGRVLDQAVSQAARQLLTGQAQKAGTTQSAFNSWIRGKTYSLFNCANFMVNVQNYASFAAADTSTPTLTFNASGQVTNNWNYSPGAAGDVVVVQVMYQWPIQLSLLGFNLSNLSNGNRLLISTAAFKNEPF